MFFSLCLYVFCEHACVWIFFVVYVFYVNTFWFVICVQSLLFTFHIVLATYIMKRAYKSEIFCHC